MKKNKVKSVILFTALTTLSIHIVNRFISYFSVLKEILARKNGNYYKWRFGNIFYTKQGSGPSILLIHDLTLGSSSYEWTNIVKTLSKTNTVYTVDLLGCGRSDKPQLTYTNFFYVQMITDFVKNIVGHKCDVIATGLSGSFTIMACHNDNSLFNKIMLINPENLYNLNKIPTKRSKILKFLIEVPIFGTFLYNILANYKNMENVFKNEYFYNPGKCPSKYIRAYYEAAHLGKADSKNLYASIRANYANANIVHALKEINNSIYLLGGAEKDDIDSTLENYIYFNPSIEKAVIPKTKQLPQLELPDKVLEYIYIFFDYTHIR